MKKKIIEIEGIGPVLFEESAKAKHLNISIKPFSGIRVAVPKRLSFTKAKKIVLSKYQWIDKNLEKIRAAEKKAKPIQLQFENFNNNEIKRALIQRLEYLSSTYNIPYNKVTIRNQKTRWGSCSGNNNISLNIKLMLLPDELRDYVIMHELVHTRIKNHSKEFWKELDYYFPHSKNLDKKLRDYKYY